MAFAKRSVQRGVSDLRSKEQERTRLVRRNRIYFLDRIRFWPVNAPGETNPFHRPDDITGQIELPPFQAMRGAARLGVVIVVVTLAKSSETNPKIVFAVICRVIAPIPERRHVTDRIHRPGEIVNHQHRDVEAPEKTRAAQRQIKSSRHEEVRNDVEIGALPKPAVPNLPNIGRVTERAVTESFRLPHQPHHVGIGKTVQRAVNILIRVRFEMMITVIAYPGDRITREDDG